MMVVRYVLWIVAQSDNALQEFVDDDTPIALFNAFSTV